MASKQIRLMNEYELKLLDHRLRRVAARQRLKVEKSRRRDHRAYDYNTYRVVDTSTGDIVAGSDDYGLTLSEVARKLLGANWRTN